MSGGGWVMTMLAYRVKITDKDGSVWYFKQMTRTYYGKPIFSTDPRKYRYYGAHICASDVFYGYTYKKEKTAIAKMESMKEDENLRGHLVELETVATEDGAQRGAGAGIGVDIDADERAKKVVGKAMGSGNLEDWNVWRDAAGVYHWNGGMDIVHYAVKLKKRGSLVKAWIHYGTREQKQIGEWALLC